MEKFVRVPLTHQLLAAAVYSVLHASIKNSYIIMEEFVALR